MIWTVWSPVASVALAPLSVMLKLPAAADTVSVNVCTTLVTPLPLAVMVSGYVPGATTDWTEISSNSVVVAPTVAPSPARLVIPVGRPVTVTVTVPVKLPLRVMVVPSSATAPGAIVAVLAERVSAMALVAPVPVLPPDPQEARKDAVATTAKSRQAEMARRWMAIVGLTGLR